jgi:hypothetical protein
LLQHPLDGFSQRGSIVHIGRTLDAEVMVAEHAKCRRVRCRQGPKDVPKLREASLWLARSVIDVVAREEHNGGVRVERCVDGAPGRVDMCPVRADLKIRQKRHAATSPGIWEIWEARVNTASLEEAGFDQHSL